jgi:hypothetical protein
MKSTKDKAEYQSFKNKELLAQGKEVKKKKNEYKSYYVLQKEIKENKEKKKIEKEAARESGMLNPKKERKERIIEENKKILEAQIFMNKMGAPSDLGRTVQHGAFKPRVAGSLGKWKNGNLILSKQDVSQITGKPWYKITK